MVLIKSRGVLLFFRWMISVYSQRLPLYSLKINASSLAREGYDRWANVRLGLGR
jgi:hypothetical protein